MQKGSDSMRKSAMIRARVEPELKSDAEKIFKDLGLTTTEAITLFYNQVKSKRGLPFRVNIPNEITLETAKKTNKDKELNEYNDLDEFTKKMGI